MEYTRVFGELRPHTIVVLRALHLGDMLCSVPAFRALKSAFPRAEITLLGLPWARSFVKRFNHYLDDFLEFPGYPGIPERPPLVHHLPRFLSRAQDRRFDLALQMHGNGNTTNPFIMLLGARENAGFYLPGKYCPDRERFLPYPVLDPEIWRHLRLMEFLGVPLKGDGLEFPVSQEDRMELEAIDQVRTLRPGEYVCMHPGANAPARRWSAERFATVADALARHGLQVVITGTLSESELTSSVAGSMRARAVNLTGLTSLGALAALMDKARLIVSNDTGISHIAEALKVPSVVIFMGSNVQRWAPLDRQLHRVVRHAVDCSPCSHVVCPIDHRCALGVTPEGVVAEAEIHLRKDNTRVA